MAYSDLLQHKVIFIQDNCDIKNTKFKDMSGVYQNEPQLGILDILMRMLIFNIFGMDFKRLISYLLKKIQIHVTAIISSIFSLGKVLDQYLDLREIW